MIEMNRPYSIRMQDSVDNPHRVGDLAHMPADVRVHVINESVKNMLARRSTLDAIRIANERQGLYHELESFGYYVRNPDNYPPEAREILQKRFEEADRATAGLTMDQRVASRLSKFDGLHIVSDYDNTITDASRSFKTSGFVEVNSNNYLTTFIPGSVIGEDLLKRYGRDQFPEVFASIWQALVRDPKGYEVFKLAGAEIPFREGVPNFLKYAQERGIEVTVASANFEPFVRGGLEKVPEAKGVNLIAVTPESIISTSKGDLLTHLAQTEPNKATIFIGDGESDLPSLEAKDTVACYFALEGSAFATELENREIPYFIYRDFNDIQKKLQELRVLTVKSYAGISRI